MNNKRESRIRPRPNKIIKYVLKNFVALTFYLLGGIYLLKFILRKNPVLIVLNYHNFSKFHNFKLTRGSLLESNYSENFERQIAFLSKHFRFSYPHIFFSENDQSKNLNVLITFDDGYKDNFQIAYPILMKYKVSTIFFIPTSLISTKKWLWHDKVYYLVNQGIIDIAYASETLLDMNRGNKVPEKFKELVDENFKFDKDIELMMNWGNISEINDKGFLIGSHTCNHAILSSLNYKEQEVEIGSSIEEINRKLGISCNYIAYPNGLYNEDTMRIMDQLNIEYGLTSQSGINTISDNRKLLKRIGLNASDSIYVLLLKIFINSIR
jgi:peptidoglycan/xylan/chitin deacetylase (PgdA/CDA1 family)